MDAIDIRMRTKRMAEDLRALADDIETLRATGALDTPTYAIGPAEHTPSTIAAINSAAAQLTFYSDRIQWAYDMRFLDLTR